MQELIANRTIGRDRPQEDVQLTELLPVKQSRIKGNDIFKDANATDALKVLHSFTGTCQEEQDFGLHVFEFNETVSQPSELQLNDKLNNDVPSGQNVKIDLEDSELLKSTKTGEKQKFVKIKSNKIVRKGRINLKPSRNMIIKNLVNIKKIEKSSNCEEQELNVADKDEIFSDKEETIHLELEKTKNGFKDEIYVFRCDPLETSYVSSAQDSTINLEVRSDTEDTNSMTNDVSFSDDSATNPLKINKSKPDEDVNIIPKSPKKSQKSDEKEIQFKINAIIQANLLAKRHNNNVLLTSNRNKVEAEASVSLNISEKNIEKPSKQNLKTKVSKSLKTKDKNGYVGQEEDNEEEVEKKYCCVVCEARFKGSGGLRNHYKVVHGAGPLFKCDECGKEFPLKERLKLHVRTHTGFKPYKCNECDKSFARGGQLVQHRRTHSQVKPYRCALCSGTFTCAANLALHLKRHNGQKDHKCDICGRGFVRRDALKKHLECLHRDVKSFLCNICNKTFKGHLPQHMRTHIRDRPHGCATCGQRFAQKSQLTVHQRTHSGQRPFRCLVCWQAFAHSTALKLHTRRHTGERPFKCVECNAGFTQLPHWKKHMKCIHGRNEPYSCKNCNSFFRIKNDLESHEKTCHPEMDDQARATSPNNSECQEKGQVVSKYRVMNIERMRLLLAVLLKRISRQERLDELGFGKRLIDEVLHDSLKSAGKTPASGDSLSEFEILSKNLETFLRWTVPKEHWEQFQKMNKTPEDILETLTAT